MDAIEQTIRNALEKGDPRDELHRRRVYLNAYSVFERVLGENKALNTEEREQRWTILRSSILTIESEFSQAAYPDRPLSACDTDETLLDTALKPPGDLGEFSEQGGRMESEDASDEGVYKEPFKKRRRNSRYLAISLVAAAICGVAWWSVQYGFVRPASDARNALSMLISAVEAMGIDIDRTTPETEPRDRKIELRNDRAKDARIGSKANVSSTETGSAEIDHAVSGAALIDTGLATVELGVPESTDVIGPDTAGRYTIHSRLAAAPSSQTTGGAYMEIGSDIERAVSGKTIRATVWVRRANDIPSQMFALAYSTNSVGNSGWHMFTPLENFGAYSFEYDVPAAIGEPGQDYLGIWADTSGSGGGIQVERIRIEVLNVAEPSIPAASLLVNNN